MRFSSAPDDWIGLGQSRSYTIANATFRAVMDLNRHHVQIDVESLDRKERWTLHIAAPEGEQLTRRTYERAVRWPSFFPSFPGFSLWGSGRGCNSVTARFAVRGLELGSLGEVERFAMTFAQNCDGASGELTGEIAIFDGGSR